MSKNSFSKLAEEDGDDLPTINRVHSAPLAELPLEDLNPHRAELSLVEKDKPSGESHTSNWIFVSAFFISTASYIVQSVLRDAQLCLLS